MQPLLKKVFKEPHLASYKRRKSLKDILVRSKLWKWLIYTCVKVVQACQPIFITVDARISLLSNCQVQYWERGIWTPRTLPLDPPLGCNEVRGKESRKKERGTEKRWGCLVQMTGVHWKKCGRKVWKINENVSRESEDAKRTNGVYGGTKPVNVRLCTAHFFRLFRRSCFCHLNFIRNLCL